MNGPNPLGKMDSRESVKNMLKKKSGGGENATYIKYIPKEGITVRFVSEPDSGGWAHYMECWDDGRRTSYPFADHLIEGVDFTRKSKKFLTNAIVRSEGPDQDHIVPIKLPKTVMDSLWSRYEKYGTLVDRDYELERFGEGKETTYQTTPEAPVKIDFSKYEPHDLEKVLVAAYDAVFSADGENEVSTENAPKRNVQHKGSAFEEELEEIEFEEEDSDEMILPETDVLMAMPWNELVALGVKWGIPVGAHKNRKSLIPALEATAF